MDYEHNIENLESLVDNLSNIGIQLSAEKDTDKLLNTILDESMKITNADAGSIYLSDGESLIFSVTKSNSRSIPFKSFKLPINTCSIAGSCAYNKCAYNFTSMTELPEKLGITHNSSFDESINYRTMNMLVIPMKNLKDEILGVMQLINKKKEYSITLADPVTFDDYIISFTSREQQIISSLASQAAILIERSDLYDEIKHLFTSFIESMVTTIDQRDPATAGHSIRVANYSVALANAVSKSKFDIFETAFFDDESIEQIYYAGLLHDIGKIGIKENILLKQNKLTDDAFNALVYRLKFIEKDILLKSKTSACSDIENKLLIDMPSFLEELANVNKRGFVDNDTISKLQDIAKIDYVSTDNENIPILTEFELINLTVQRGNLTSDERGVMESHALMTYSAIKDIPWSDSLKNVPTIALSHHEKLDGTGYPHKISAESLPMEARILAIADIFDALTAADRPYKPALSLEKTLSILNEEADHNHIDRNLLDLFISSKCYSEIYKG